MATLGAPAEASPLRRSAPLLVHMTRRGGHGLSSSRSGTQLPKWPPPAEAQWAPLPTSAERPPRGHDLGLIGERVPSSHEKLNSMLTDLMS